ncbi:signal transducer and activator of transcription 5A-like [Dermatophagoides pteronyssinus]|uniref:signal transducer and activator of transcription 5A-like n=1 Tax=Dermatophagoides pteronyssinus TaxID=6956 RepID=UPI003F66799B
MSVWSRILSLPEDQQRQLFSIYNQNLPIEIRMQLADWIEQQNWQYFVENDTMMKCELIQRFSIEIKNLIEMSNDVAYRYKLVNYWNMITNSNADIHAIIKNIHDCLSYEKEFIRCNNQESVPFPQVNLFDNFQKLNQMNVVIKDNIGETETLFKNIKSLKETFNIKQLEISNFDNQKFNNNNNPNDNAIKMRFMENVNSLHLQYQTHMNDLINKYRDIIVKLQEMSLLLFNELDIWKQQQKSKMDSSETYLQLKNLSEKMASNLGNLLQQLKFIDALVSNDSTQEDAMIIAQFIEIKKHTTLLFKNLISETFIVKNQPKQVIKKETKFNATVTMLAGSELNVHMNSLVVRVQIINEEQAKIWNSDHEKFHLSSCCGEIVNNTTVMEYNSATNTLSANFINLRLKSIKRAEKKASIDKVVDEKFALLFLTEIFLESDIKFVISTISVPVVVIVHGNQKIHALSTIIWDNAFSEVKRIPFNVPTEVKLGELAQVLSRQFYDHTRRHLSEDNMHFLAEKISGHEVDKQNFFNIMVPWTKFSKDLLPEQNFTFWDWFYNILQLTREHLAELWADGLIIGFLTRQRAEMLLMTKAPGTFLLRFSDTQLGGISVAYRNIHNKVECLVPFVSNDLKIRKLADRLNDFNQFVYLFPEIPKDTAFSKYYTKIENQASNGYVFTQLKNCIPSETDKESGNYESMNDPHSVNNIINDTALGTSFNEIGSMTNMSFDTNMSTSYEWNRNPNESMTNDEFNYIPIDTI